MLVNQSILVLYNDEVHDISNIILKDCQEHDEDHFETVPTAKLIEIFKQVKISIKTEFSVYK